MPGAESSNRFESLTDDKTLLINYRVTCILPTILPDSYRLLLFIQAYEALHELLEISDADKQAALQRISQLERERTRVYDYAINEGLQLPSSLCADND